MHESVFQELIEWREDSKDGRIDARLLVLEAPNGWGKSALLSRFASYLDEEQSSAWKVKLDNVEAPVEAGLLPRWLDEQTASDRPINFVTQVFGVDSPEGAATLAVGIGALTVAPMLGGPLGLLLAVGLGAEHAIRTRVFPDAAAIAERVGARLSAASREGPVVLIVDDADDMDADVVDALLSGAMDRVVSRVLAVVSVKPGSDIGSRLKSSERFGLLKDRLRWIDVPDIAMTNNERREIARALVSEWPQVAMDRLVLRTRTFDEVLEICQAPGARDIASATDPLQAVDRLADETLALSGEDLASIVLAWCGGVLHESQLRAVVLGEGWEWPPPQNLVVLHNSVARLRQPGDTDRLRTKAHIRFDGEGRRRIAGLIVDRANDLADANEFEPYQAAAALRCIPVLLQCDPPDLAPSEALLNLCKRLITIHESVDDVTRARELSEQCLSLADGIEVGRECRDGLTAQYLRLTALVGAARSVADLTSLVVDRDASAVFGLEARVWATILRIEDPATRATALQDAMEFEAALDPSAIGSMAYEFRLQLGRVIFDAQAIDLAARILNPLIALDTNDPFRKTAEEILIASPAAGSRWTLAIMTLEGELDQTSESLPQERLRICSALAGIYERIGDWRSAVERGLEAWSLSVDVLGDEHPRTLRSGHALALSTARAGDFDEALRRARDLLPRFDRVFGPKDPGTLGLRHNIASWIGEKGDHATALRLVAELLPEMINAIGDDHKITLATRGDFAQWTARNGDPERALQMLEQMLPDVVRVFGADDWMTFQIRGNIAGKMGGIGKAEDALRHYQELLADQERILGPYHPDTLATRNNIAGWTFSCGDALSALGMFNELIPDLARVLGPDHPNTLTTRGNTADLSARLGDFDGALRIAMEIYEDRVRILGSDHRDAHATQQRVDYFRQMRDSAVEQ